MLYAEHTDALLVKAGIRQGMRVLDVGCGVGDVTLQIARMVGPEGSVIGVDIDPDVLDVARERAVHCKLDNVIFEQGDIQNLPFAAEFDALVGRLILMHLDDPVSVMKSLVKHVKIGGVVTFQDCIATNSSSSPFVPLFADCARWVREALRISGRNPDIGHSLQQIFAESGLRSQVAMRIPTFSYQQLETVDFTVSTVNSVADLILENRIATYDEIASPGLADRLQRDLTEARAEVCLPTLVGAWAIR
jgi:ubiquinone/menaquinone biosynthesis C-methylase UbiE